MKQSQRVQVYDSDKWRHLLRQVVDESIHTIPQSVVLDAGCGSNCHIVYPENVYLVGIDNCEEAIRRNTQVREAVIGDLQTYSLPEERFDLITCIDVVEHLPFPERALENMWRALKPGGTLVIRAPYLYSVKGLVTKFTPHWFHVMFRKNILRNPNAGKPGYPPFKTYLRASVAPHAIIRWATQKGGIVKHFFLRDGSNPYQLRQRSFIVWLLFRALTFLVTLVSLGRIREYSDYLIVLQKPAPHS